MKLFKCKLCLISILMVFISTVVVFASDEDMSFAFLLYLDNGRLVPDRDSEVTFDIDTVKYTASPLSGDIWGGKVFDYDGSVLHEFSFSPKNGSNWIYAPFHSKAVRVAFYNPSGFRSLAISVNNDGLNFCDFNGICSSDLQENGLTCPNDCPWEMPVNLPAGSPESSPAAGPAPSEFSFIPFIFLTIFLIVGIIVGYIIFRTFRAQ